MLDPFVLIVGVGPTGPNLARRLARHAIASKIIDRYDQPERKSRALALNARTLEFHRQLGLAGAIVAAGTEIHGIQLHEGVRECAQINVRDIGEGLSP